MRLWLERIAPQLPAGLPAWEPVVRLHYRLRFDPRGLTPEERERLRRESAALLAGLAAARPAARKAQAKGERV
ncbi:MAG: hypothetical protein N3J91_02990 [Verrucomicrobiae bacterium]|nr:hypothetical protein [Verrucomicrobiae bacterium]